MNQTKILPFLLFIAVAFTSIQCIEQDRLLNELAAFDNINFTRLNEILSERQKELEEERQILESLAEKREERNKRIRERRQRIECAFSSLQNVLQSTSIVSYQDAVKCEQPLYSKPEPLNTTQRDVPAVHDDLPSIDNLPARPQPVGPCKDLSAQAAKTLQNAQESEETISGFINQWLIKKIVPQEEIELKNID